MTVGSWWVYGANDIDPQVEKGHGEDMVCNSCGGVCMKFLWIWQLWHLRTNWQQSAFMVDQKYSWSIIFLVSNTPFM